MWIARNKDGQLKLFVGKPVRWSLNSIGNNIWVDTLGWDDHTAYGFPYTLTFGWESLNWEDDPVEVEIVPKKKELTRDDWQIIVYKIKEISMCSLREALDTYKSDRDGWVEWYNKGEWKNN